MSLNLLTCSKDDIGFHILIQSSVELPFRLKDVKSPFQVGDFEKSLRCGPSGIILNSLMLKLRHTLCRT